MPEAVYGLPTGGRVYPQIVQVTGAAGGSGSASATLPYMPLTGRILVGTVCSQSGGTPTLTGGGATWTRYEYVALTSGTQIMASLYLGVVGSTPSTSVSCTWNGNGGGLSIAEVNGIYGDYNGGQSTVVSTATVTLPAVRTFRYGLVVGVTGARAAQTQAVAGMRMLDSRNGGASWHRLWVSVVPATSPDGLFVLRETLATATSHAAICGIVF